jgi:hypothetical protein
VHRFSLRVLEALLLDDQTWHAHDRSLRPELEKPPEAPSAPAKSEPAAALPPPPSPPAQTAPPPAPVVEAPPASEPEKPRRSTDEVRTYRIADTGDVVEPEVRPGEPPPSSDDEANLVDSEAADIEDDKDKPAGGGA